MRPLKVIEIVIVRALGFPFFAALSLIGLMVLYVKYMKNYALYGGEAVSYTHETQRKCISDVFHEIVQQRKENRDHD